MKTSSDAIMKKLAPILLLSLILSACAPEAIPATSTPTFLPPTATLTPSPMPTATPVAVDGVAEVDGLLYFYDEQTQNWVALPPLPEGTIKAKADNGVLGAYGTDGILMYTLNGMEWEKAGIRYEYLSYNAQFEATLKQMVENGAFPEDLSTVERMYYEDGTPVPYGVLTSYQEGGLTFYAISGVMGKGWIDPGVQFGAPEGTYGSPLVLVPMADGSRVVLTPSSFNVVGFPQNIVFLPGAVAKEPWKSLGRVLVESTAAEVFEFMRQQTGEGGQLVSKQVIFYINTAPEQFKDFKDYNRNLRELIAWLQGKGGDLEWDASPFKDPMWYWPDIDARP